MVFYIFRYVFYDFVLNIVGVFFVMNFYKYLKVKIFIKIIIGFIFLVIFENVFGYF